MNYANEAVFVNWKAPASGSSPASYIVTCTGQTAQDVLATGSVWQKCVFYGLTNGTTPTVTVAGVNAGGTGSAAISSGTISIQRPSTRTNAGDMLAANEAAADTNRQFKAISVPANGVWEWVGEMALVAEGSLSGLNGTTGAITLTISGKVN